MLRSSISTKGTSVTSSHNVVTVDKAALRNWGYSTQHQHHIHSVLSHATKSLWRHSGQCQYMYLSICQDCQHCCSPDSEILGYRRTHCCGDVADDSKRGDDLEQRKTVGLVNMLVRVKNMMLSILEIGRDSKGRRTDGGIQAWTERDRWSKTGTGWPTTDTTD